MSNIELNALAGTATASNSTMVVTATSADAGDTGTLLENELLFAAAYEAVTSLPGYISLSSSDALVLIHGSTLYSATLGEVVDAGARVILHGYSGDGPLANSGTCLLEYAPTAPTSINYTFSAGCMSVKVGAAATNTTTLTLSNNGTAVGSVVVPASSTTPTVTVSSGFTQTAGTKLALTGPNPADATLAHIATTIMGYR